MSRCAKIVAARRKFEVRLTDEEAAAARTLLSQLIEGAAGALPVEAKLPDLACRIHSSRHERRRFFPDELFADPAWDMILALYCAESRGERLSVTSLGYSVGLAQATAARWISQLRVDRSAAGRARRPAQVPSFVVSSAGQGHRMARTGGRPARTQDAD